MRRLAFLSAVVLALTAPTVARATDYTVDPSVGGTTCTGTNCPTVAAAAAAVSSAGGDTIKIKPGTYAESVTFNQGGPSTTTITRVATGLGVVRLTGNGIGPPLRFTGAGPYRVAGIEVLASGGANGLEISSAQGETAGKSLTLESVVLSGSGSDASGLLAQTAKLSSAAPITITARHVTVADGGLARAVVLDQSASGAGTVTATLKNSIVSGSTATLGGATITQQNDDTATPPHFLFVDHAVEDFHLRADAPNVIDSGAGADSGETTVDIDGQSRPASATWDKGADEFVESASPTAPALVVDNSGPTAGFPASFTASGATDADVGDTLSYLWTFGDGAPDQQTATPSTTHAYAAAGTYQATVRAVDFRGNASPRSNVVTLRVSALRLDSAPQFDSGGGGLGRPVLQILSPRPNQAIRRIRRTTVRRGGRRVSRTVRLPLTLRGRAAAGAGLGRIELALVLINGRTCRYYDGARALKRPGACIKPTFFRASLADFAWSYTIPARVVLPRGSYLLLARATDLAGVSTATFSQADGTAVPFKLR